MLKGYNLIGFKESKQGNTFLQSFSPVNKNNLPETFSIATEDEVNTAVIKATNAFTFYKEYKAGEKALFLETIADEIMAVGDELIQRAMLETGLPEARLIGERGRTTGQLKLFAEVLKEGSWVEAVIDTAMPDRKPLPRADLRKMLVPIGPVAVFGASNFPLAFSTAGGDTASALAAGNPVIVKAHESHLGTNELVASAIFAAAKKCNVPDGVFSFVIGEGSVTGMQLVKHPGISAVGFTGSYNAGMAIYKAAINEREVPIPVYAEMSSINPVLVLPGKLSQDIHVIATQLANSITLGVGQFCTNPGLVFLLENETSTSFINMLTRLLSDIPAAPMLNANVCKNYYENKLSLAQQIGVTTLLASDDANGSNYGSAALLQVNANTFAGNPALQKEMFGPASMIIICKNEWELEQALQSLHGQLTATVFALKTDIEKFTSSINILSAKAGRIVYNGVPTGVEVSYAMVHGGPFPATTNAGSTSVGADAIKRFVRPICLQDCHPEFLPDALKNDNPLNIMRKVNGQYTKAPVQ
jgi:alpha-ketoglutaric semialdehyde dehydrogenase